MSITRLRPWSINSSAPGHAKIIAPCAPGCPPWAGQGQRVTGGDTCAAWPHNQGIGGVLHFLWQPPQENISATPSRQQGTCAPLRAPLCHRGVAVQWVWGNLGPLTWQRPSAHCTVYSHAAYECWTVYPGLLVRTTRSTAGHLAVFHSLCWERTAAYFQ